MKQSEHREKPIKRRRVQRNRRAEDRKIVIMWAKRIAVAVMVMFLLGQAYRLVAIYQIIAYDYSEQSHRRLCASFGRPYGSQARRKG